MASTPIGTRDANPKPVLGAQANPWIPFLAYQHPQEYSRDRGHSRVYRAATRLLPSVLFGKVANIKHKCENYDYGRPGKTNKEYDLQNPDEKVQHISPSSPDVIATTLKKA